MYRLKNSAKNIIFPLILLCLRISTFAAEPVTVPVTPPAEKTTDLGELKFDLQEDFIQSMKWAWQGSYKQFSGTQNLILWAVAIAGTGYVIHNDKKMSQQAVNHPRSGTIFGIINGSSVLINTPIVPMAFYYWGRSHQDTKMVKFSQEYLAALTLSLAEAAMISIIPVHERPDQKDLSFVETAFRGQSSFPSGHIMGYTVLGFKTLQFYGPHYALVPMALAAATAFERVHSAKHYASDVVASGFIALMASEGVRCAANYDKNHPIYDWIFKHEFTLNYIKKDEAPGLRVSLTF